ncbi:immunity protein Imm1 of predicted polymorphic toxin system [Halopolyspora algeriensis]|uniref:Immunity protein Imm1 of predicted polymorphic toxin system n=1 Tax=Halopolyspora algeriensis TaxID=1500506 RepID=A0A368VMH4_9ACTN|nr:Imm1 family immunity protein [Halopolyspora algeriensis]RCW42909.1 immunity protein Imm1 of predicted polymorphic toxin system [Halopolyspora algeriensis]TQM56622.1 immunity protein Imm1 of predicted polymorphic toxin system [Halopolyspora algeriensis]
MTITAVWPISSTYDPNAGDGLTVTDPAGIDDLVARLSEPTAGPATIWHEQREPVAEDTEMLDHDVLAVVHDGYAYLSYIDAGNDFAILDGDPASPGFAGEDIDFPPGSGVSTQLLAEALREFLRTGRRPAAVSWQPVEP